MPSTPVRYDAKYSFSVSISETPPLHNNMMARLPAFSSKRVIDAFACVPRTRKYMRDRCSSIYNAFAAFLLNTFAGLAAIHGLEFFSFITPAFIDTLRAAYFIMRAIFCDEFHLFRFAT